MTGKIIKFFVVFLAVCVSLTATAATRKYHPGHYVKMYKTDGPTQMISVIKPGVVGVVRTYSWRELEPSKGVYDFSKPQADMNLLAGQGMRMILFVGDKTFNGTYPTPPDLRGNQFMQKNMGGGYTAVRWNPTIVARYKALLAALGKKFDAQPYFEGVATPESALSLSTSALNATGYTPEKYRDALIHTLTGAATSFPTSRVFWGMNFLIRNQAYLANIATAVAPYGVVMGAPDDQPDNASLKKQTYPLYNTFNGKMKLFVGIEGSCYNHLHADKSYRTKYWTPAELLVFARDKLHVSYIFWTRVPRPQPADSYAWPDAIPVVGSHPALNF